MENNVIELDKLEVALFLLWCIFVQSKYNCATERQLRIACSNCLVIFLLLPFSLKQYYYYFDFKKITFNVAHFTDVSYKASLRQF